LNGISWHIWTVPPGGEQQCHIDRVGHGAALPFLADADLIGTDPWDGVTFGRDGTEDAAATTSIAGRPHRVTVTSGSTGLARDGRCSAPPGSAAGSAGWRRPQDSCRWRSLRPVGAEAILIIHEHFDPGESITVS
jgi:hypothetical protein